MTGDLGLFCGTPKSELHAAGDVFCTPGYWVALVAQARATGIAFDQLGLSKDQRGYLQALRAPEVLGLEDTYPHVRIRQGVNYSPLVSLNSEGVVDAATSAMQGCIRSLVSPDLQNDFASDLCDVVGDLHDNVWSHAQSPGVSMAQKWNARGWGNAEQVIEFALADSGRGFLGELHRVGLAPKLGIPDDRAAIAWCVAKGNSSKLSRSGDDWMQSLPADHMGNPMGSFAGVTHANHHLGLGLAKLISCVRKYKGRLWLASGGHHLSVDPNGSETYVENARPWRGVAIACRFDTASLKTISAGPADPTVSLIESVIARESAK
jgi:hypothetical protein